MKTLNLGILAHVDAGKTSLTERLLYRTGAIDRIGSVDAGTTQTDTLALERQRGITIRSAVASFVVDGLTVNLVDTPGHPDFIAEVERVLSVLDGAVLVISAVEGVQAQTQVLMRVLQRLRIPTILFVNKIDRAGADVERVLRRIARRLSPAIMPMGSVEDLGTRSARFVPSTAGDADFAERLIDLLGNNDDALLAAYLEDETAISHPELLHALAEQTARALVHPLFFGSAITGAGIDDLITGITTLLPAGGSPGEGDGDAPVIGTVFKIERGPAREKIAYVRMFGGTIHVRERVRFGPEHEAKVTGLAVFERGGAIQRPAIVAGQIGKLWGLAEVRIGDTIGAPRTNGERHFFAPPTLETIIVPRRSADRSGLHAALAQLAEQDPLINLRRDEMHEELFVSLYGEVQKEVLQATLADDYAIEVAFRETTTICVERVIGCGAALDLLGKGENPFLATIGLRVVPGPAGSGVTFALDVKADTVPIYVFKSVEEFQRIMEDTVQDVLRQGLCGWQVVDCQVTMTQSGYTSPGTTAKDYRLLTPLVVMDALKQAGTVVCEPIQRFQLEIPVDTYGRFLPVLAHLQANAFAPVMEGSLCLLEGEIPAGRVHELYQQLPGLTRGEGVLETVFSHYAAVAGPAPTRKRTDLNPLNRKEYLLNVGRRI